MKYFVGQKVKIINDQLDSYKLSAIIKEINGDQILVKTIRVVGSGIEYEIIPKYVHLFSKDIKYQPANCALKIEPIIEALLICDIQDLLFKINSNKKYNLYINNLMKHYLEVKYIELFYRDNINFIISNKYKNFYYELEQIE